MELRSPPSTPAAPARDTAVRGLLIVNLLALLGLGAFVALRSGGAAADPGSAEHARDVASKLKAAGALDEAAALYEVYLASTDAPPKTRANVAYSLGSTYLDTGRYERALRWFYEAESLGVGELHDQLAKKIVHALERLGRYHSAKAVLDSRVALDTGAGGAQHSEDDPVVAQIGDEPVYRSQVLRLLDDLPPEMAAQLQGAQRGELLKQYVANELLWRKAVKLEYDKDPEVRRSYEALLKQLAIQKFVERDVVTKIKVDPADLKNYFEANKAKYQKEGEELTEMPPEVERDYQMSKFQTVYQEVIDTELKTEDVKLFPERMADAQ